MSVSVPSEMFKLPITVPDNPVFVESAKGPERWANLLAQTALAAECGSVQDLRKKLSLGDVAVGVVFGPEDWGEAIATGSGHTIYGDLKVEGNSLDISAGVPKNPGGYSSMTFRRSSAHDPYLPVSYQWGNTNPEIFPRDTDLELPTSLERVLRQFSDSTVSTLQRFSYLDDRFRWAPYVRMRRPDPSTLFVET